MVYAAGSVRLLCDVLDHASGEVLATEQLISTSMMRSSWCTELQIDIHRFDVCDCDPETSWRYRTLLGVVNSATTAADALAQDDNSDGFDTADESETRDLPPPIIALTVQYTPSSELTNVVRVLMRPVQVVYSPTGTCRWHPYPVVLQVMQLYCTLATSQKDRQILLTPYKYNPLKENVPMPPWN